MCFSLCNILILDDTCYHFDNICGNYGNYEKIIKVNKVHIKVK